MILLECIRSQWERMHRSVKIDGKNDMAKPNSWLNEFAGNVTSQHGENGWADLCFCMRLFHHMDNDQLRLNALRELSRVSRKFVALSFYNHNLRFYRKKMLGKKIRGNFITYNHLEVPWLPSNPIASCSTSAANITAAVLFSVNNVSFQTPAT